MRSLYERRSGLFYRIFIAASQNRVTYHQRRDIGFTVAIGGPLVQQAARQAFNSGESLEAAPLDFQGMYRVDGFRDHG